MNQAIIKRIFKYFGLPDGDFSIMSKNYKLKKHISLEIDNAKILHKNLYGIEGKIGMSQVRALAMDASDISNSPEFILLFQLDDLSTYIFTLDIDTARCYVGYDDNKVWIELSSLLLARALVGIEQLNEMFIQYDCLQKYDVLYANLVSFLNYEEAAENLNKT